MQTTTERGTRPGLRRVAAPRTEIGAKPEDLLDPAILEGLARLAAKMRRSLPALKCHEPEDLVQSILELALQRLDQFQARSSLKTWVTSLGRNRLVDLSRRAAIRPLPAGEAVEHARAVTKDGRAQRIREEIMDLHRWLALEGAKEVPHGQAVLTLLVNSAGDFDYVATRLSRWQNSPWTAGAVRRVVEKIKRTEGGRAMREALAVFEKKHEEESA